MPSPGRLCPHCGPRLSPRPEVSTASSSVVPRCTSRDCTRPAREFSSNPFPHLFFWPRPACPSRAHPLPLPDLLLLSLLLRFLESSVQLQVTGLRREWFRPHRHLPSSPVGTSCLFMEKRKDGLQGRRGGSMAQQPLPHEAFAPSFCSAISAVPASRLLIARRPPELQPSGSPAPFEGRRSGWREFHLKPFFFRERGKLPHVMWKSSFQGRLGGRAVGFVGLWGGAWAREKRTDGRGE